MTALSTLTESHLAAGAAITEASRKDTADMVYSHIRSNLTSFLGVPATSLAAAFKDVSEDLSGKCASEVKVNWRGTHYFKRGDTGRTARQVAANLAEKSYLFNKLSEHVATDSLTTFEYALQPRDDERIFRPYAREALSLGVSTTNALIALNATTSPDNRKLLIRQRNAARQLKFFPDYAGAPEYLQAVPVSDGGTEEGSTVSSASDP